MTNDDLMSLIRGGETQTLELKANVPSPDLIARYLSAFANTEGGFIVFGVQEPFEIVGIDREKLEKAFEISKRSITSKFHCVLEFLNISGKVLGVIKIKKADKPIVTKEGVYIRHGEQTRAQTPEEIISSFSRFPSKDQSIAELSKALSDQTKIIQDLREDFNNANSWKRKALFAGIGAAGTAIGKGIWELIKPWLIN